MSRPEGSPGRGHGVNVNVVMHTKKNMNTAPSLGQKLRSMLMFVDRQTYKQNRQMDRPSGRFRNRNIIIYTKDKL